MDANNPYPISLSLKFIPKHKKNSHSIWLQFEIEVLKLYDSLYEQFHYHSFFLLCHEWNVFQLNRKQNLIWTCNFMYFCPDIFMLINLGNKTVQQKLSKIIEKL